jgi:threonine/homoserine/homoserine lactone efflux protein
MAAWDVLLAFLLATAVFAYMPGPGVLYTAARTLAGGRRAGYFAAIGIHVGGYAHVLAATLGLAAVLDLVPELYIAMKLAGALYLIWLGIGLVRNRGAAVSPERVSEATRSLGSSAWRSFLQSVAVEALNPKTALFFLAFLPQFADPAGSLPVWAQMLALGVFVNLAFSSADLIAVVLASAVAARFQRSARTLVWARRLGGTILIGLGLRLAAERG